MNLNIKAINLIFLIFIFISLFSIKNIINASECKINGNVVETDDTCIGEIKNTNSSVFGKFENKQLNGLIEAKFANDSIYVGGSKNSKLEGYGFRKYPNGDEFIGDFKNDIFREGIQNENTGFINYFKLDEEGKFQGFHAILYPNNERIYIGEIKNQLIDGEGFAYNLLDNELGDKDSYEIGIFKNGKLKTDYSKSLPKCKFDKNSSIESNERCFGDKKFANIRSVGLFINKKLSLGFEIFDSGFLSLGQFKPRQKGYSSGLHGVGSFIQANRKQIQFGKFHYGDRHGYTVIIDERRGYSYFGEIYKNRKNGFGFERDNEYHEYLGIFKDDYLDGYGEKYLIKENIRYKGTFKKNILDGVGTYENNDIVYYGEFKDNIFNGLGKLTDKQKSKKVGFFNNGNFETNYNFCVSKDTLGYNKIIYGKKSCGSQNFDTASIDDFLNQKTNFFNYDNWNAEYYTNRKKPYFAREDMEECKIVNNFVDSFDKCYGTIMEEGRKFSGVFINGKKNGFGYYVILYGEEEGDKFEGNWVDDLKNGWGKYTTAQGANTIAKYIDGIFQTNFFLYNGGPAKYENDQIVFLDENEGSNEEEIDDWFGYLPCELKDNIVITLKECKVKKLVVGDTEFTGIYYNAMRNGYGELLAGEKKDTKYKGNFVDNKFEGDGILIYPDKQTYIGNFKNNNFNGQGAMYYPDGTTYYGNFIKGWQTGKGKLVYRNGDIVEGEFLNGNIIGNFYFNDKLAKLVDGVIVLINE